MNTPAGFEPAFAFSTDPAGDAVCFVWRDDKMLVSAADPPALPTLSDLAGLGIDGTRLYLGRLNGVDCLALRAASDTAEPAGWQWRGLRSLFLKIPDVLLAVGTRRRLLLHLILTEAVIVTTLGGLAGLLLGQPNKHQLRTQN